MFPIVTTSRVRHAGKKRLMSCQDSKPDVQ
jgi:hypothetical protein